MSKTVWPTTTDVTNLIASAGINLDVHADPSSALNNAIAYFERRTSRSYTQVTEVRYYDSPGSLFINIDPCQNITEVWIDNQLGQQMQNITTDILAFPRNSTLKNRLKRFFNVFSAIGVENIEVHATFGELSIPDDVWQAVQYLASVNLIDASGTEFAGGITSFTTADSYSQKNNDQPFEWQIARWRDYAEKVISLNTMVRFMS